MVLTVKDAANTTKSIATSTVGGAEVPYNLLESPWLLRASRGLESSYTVVRLLGRNPAVDTTQEDLWTAGGSMTYIGAATTLTIVSGDAADASAGTGARTVTIWGLSGAYVEQSETVTMNGTTSVGTSASFLRVYRAEVATAGSAGANVGLITIKSGATALAEIAVGDNRAYMTQYTVPAGKTASVVSYYGTAQAALGLQYTLFARSFTSQVFIPRHRIEVFEGTVFVRELYEIVPEKSDIVLRALRSVGSGAIVASGGVTLVLA